jgi:hypothetical protein
MSPGRRAPGRFPGERTDVGKSTLLIRNPIAEMRSPRSLLSW